MIVVRVELHSAITHKITELARMHICNVGGTDELGDYEAMTYRGRSREQLDRRAIQRQGLIKRWPRQRLHVWNLVRLALETMRYDDGRP